MKNLKITIEYDGTNFNGWQVQSKGERTVQGEIQKALKKIFNKNIKITGSGRTDSGTHASGHVANFHVNTKLSPNEIIKAINALIPHDISIVKIEQMPDSFNALHDAKFKTYEYYILNQTLRKPFLRNTSLHYPKKLNVALMKREAAVLKGKHDFKSFQAIDTSKRYRENNTVRIIKNISVTKSNGLIKIKIEANGFLYKMVRNITGTLIAIGSEKKPIKSMKEILKSRSRSAAGDTVKAHGLMLKRVTY